MSAPLPSGGPERTLFLRALREYSTSCTPPELTPGCPFFRVDPTIGPWCREECMDVLGRYPNEMPGRVLDGGCVRFRFRVAPGALATSRGRRSTPNSSFWRTGTSHRTSAGRPHCLLASATSF